MIPLMGLIVGIYCCVRCLELTVSAANEPPSSVTVSSILSLASVRAGWFSKVVCAAARPPSASRLRNKREELRLVLPPALLAGNLPVRFAEQARRAGDALHRRRRDAEGYGRDRAQGRRGAHQAVLQDWRLELPAPDDQRLGSSS